MRKAFAIPNITHCDTASSPDNTQVVNPFRLLYQVPEIDRVKYWVKLIMAVGRKVSTAEIVGL